MAKQQQQTTTQTTTVERESPQQATEEVLLDKVLDATVTRIDRMASAYARAVEEAHGHLKKSVLLGKGIEELRKALTPEVMRTILPLMNSENGFRTDRPNSKNPSPYTEAQIKDALITALLYGFYPVNNEFNVIAGRFYGALNGYKRKVKEIHGISDVHCAPGVPAPHNGQTVCRVALTWKLNGQRGELLGSDGKPGMAFPVAGQSADQMIGKATRKAFKAAFELITGSEQTAPDMEVGEDQGPAHRTAEVIARLNNTMSNQAVSSEMLKEIGSLSRRLQLEDAEFEALLPNGLSDPQLLTRAQADVLLGTLKQRLAQEDAATARAETAFEE